MKRESVVEDIRNFVIHLDVIGTLIIFIYFEEQAIWANVLLFLFQLAALTFRGQALSVVIFGNAIGALAWVMKMEQRMLRWKNAIRSQAENLQGTLNRCYIALAMMM